MLDVYRVPLAQDPLQASRRGDRGIRNKLLGFALYIDVIVWSCNASHDVMGLAMMSWLA